MDWLDALPPLPARDAHKELRRKVQDLLTVRAKAEGALTALRVGAFACGEVAMSPVAVANLKRAEGARDEAARLAREAATAFYGDLVAEDVATWRAAIASAEAALSYAVQQLELRAVGGMDRGGAAEFEVVIGRAIMALGWTLTDLPTALRVTRCGLEIQTAGAP